MKVSCLVKVVKTKQDLTDVFRIVDVFEAAAYQFMFG